MIVKMKKITLLVLKKHSNSALRVLRQLGVVHIKYMHSPHADYINTIARRISSVGSTMRRRTNVSWSTQKVAAPSGHLTCTR